MPRPPVERRDESGDRIAVIHAYAPGDGQLSFVAKDPRTNIAIVPSPTREECAAACPDGWMIYNNGTEEFESWRARRVGAWLILRCNSSLTLDEVADPDVWPFHNKNGAWHVWSRHATTAERETELARLKVEFPDWKLVEAANFQHDPIAYKCAECGRMGAEHGHYDATDPSTHKFKCGEPIY